MVTANKYVRLVGNADSNMSDEENNRTDGDRQAAKDVNKKTLSGATHLLKAEALRRLELKTTEPDPTSESDNVASSSRPLNVDAGADRNLEDSKSPSAEEKPAEIQQEERSQIASIESEDQGSRLSSDKINYSNSDLGNKDSSIAEGSRPKDSQNGSEIEDLKVLEKVLPKEDSSSEEKKSQEATEEGEVLDREKKSDAELTDQTHGLSRPIDSQNLKSDLPGEGNKVSSSEGKSQLESKLSQSISSPELFDSSHDDVEEVSETGTTGKVITSEKSGGEAKSLQFSNAVQDTSNVGTKENVNIGEPADKDRSIESRSIDSKTAAVDQMEEKKRDEISENGGNRIKQLETKINDGETGGDREVGESQNENVAVEDNIGKETVIDESETGGKDSAVNVNDDEKTTAGKKQNDNDANEKEIIGEDISNKAGNEMQPTGAAELQDTSSTETERNEKEKTASNVVDANMDVNEVDVQKNQGDTVEDDNQNKQSTNKEIIDKQDNREEKDAMSTELEKSEVETNNEINKENMENVDGNIEKPTNEKTTEYTDADNIESEKEDPTKPQSSDGDKDSEVKTNLPSTGEKANEDRSRSELSQVNNDYEKIKTGPEQDNSCTTNGKDEGNAVTTDKRPVNVIKNLDIQDQPEVKGEGIKLQKVPKKGEEEEKQDDISNVAEEGTELQEAKEEEAIDGDLQPEGSEIQTIPSDFYYDYKEYVSKPFATNGVPEDMVDLYHSFGFECTKRSNLHMLDSNNMIFAAGNMLQILNIKTNQLKYIRSIGSGGIGAIAVHPSRKYFAVAEKGVSPNIVIYEYPSLKMYRILRNGTEMAYANLDFSPNGEKLASVGSSPDFMMTLWDWRNENVVLRSKAFSQDVYKVAFSPEDEGHLCTSGTGHIRFWKMASTFTGLKLQGELGRFGTTEISDIAGFVELPDGKVLSGSEWGNMLLWDGGLIKVEISRKGKKTCHHGMIEQFFLDEGELITIGADGFVKVWDFESIDTADAVDESKIFEMEPMSELKVGSDVKLLSMVKSVNPDEANIWFAQDAAGGIWKLDLSFSHTSQAPKKLFSYHAGTITGLAVSPVTHLSATTGSDHTVRLYDYLAKTPLCHSKFTAPGSSIIWMPKVVDPDCLSILAGFADGVMRHFTVVRGDQGTVTAKKNVPSFELKLTQVFKPHTKSITSLAVSKDGKFLATGSDDGTVFFFSIDKQKYKPVGFIETGGPVVSLDWSSVQKKNHLLICCKDGCVLEVSCPKPDEQDTSQTYLIPLSGLKRTEFKFKSIKDKLVKAEQEVRKAKEEEERQKRLEEERQKRKARGIEEDEEEGGEDEESEESVEEEEEYIYHEPGDIVRGFYRGESGHFWLLLDGWDAGFIYECEFPKPEENDVCVEPLKAVKFDDIDDIPVRSYYFSKNNQYMALGLENGAVRIQVLESHGINSLGSYWRFNMHDNQSGAIVDISMSFDEKFLLSIGQDGNFFIYSFMDEKKVKELIGKQRAEVTAKADSAKLARIDDIEDPNHYSIELEKQKAEHDKMVRLAEEKKQGIRQTISLLRREFKRLASRNQEMPSYLQLPPNDFIMDPEMKNDIEAETNKKIELLKKELAWEAEKYSLALKKLQMRFKDMIECERFTLRAFNTPHKICSYRATVLPPEFSEALEVNKNRMRTAESDIPTLAGGKRLSFMQKKTQALSKEDSGQEDLAEALQAKKAKPAQNLDSKIAKAIEKAELKKKRRLARQAEWDELYRNKPDPNKEDPLDVAAIKEAHDNMGDFKLKTAKDYIVPEKQRVNAEKKKAQLMELKEQIHQLKQNFNEKMINLRNKKIAVITEVKALTEELEKVQNGLPMSMHVAMPPIPTMHADEQPEKLYEYTEETLLKFKQKMESDKQNFKAETSDVGFGGGFGGFGGGEATQQLKVSSQMTTARTGTEQRGRSTSILSTLSSHPRSASSIPADRSSPDVISEEHMIVDEPSEMELKVREEEKIRLVYKRNMLIRKIHELLVTFDAELRTLRHEKLHLDVDLKNADLRLITLFEELVLLKEFEKRENLLMGKVVSKANEKEEMQYKLEDCQMKLETKKEDIERLQERDKALYTTFTETVGDSNKFEAFLTKVFKKKIKRIKKTEHDAGSDEDSEEEESDDDYDSEEDEDSEAEELDDSVCPPGCNPAVFDQVCQLREKRLDLEEAMVDEKKAADGLKKELDALTKKAKIIDTGLMTAEADLEAFQREKQQKLNELDVVVTLKLSQLQYLSNSTVPQDLSQSLVFTSSALERSQRRIKELEKEKAEQKKLYWQRRQKHVQLIRDNKSMETKIAELEEKVEQMQLLKFGRLVDLEKLETVSVNKVAEELKEQLRNQEFASAKEIASWEKRIDDAKARLTQVTRENTRRLETYTVLLQEQKELEHQLDSRQKNLGGEFQGNRKADYQERQQLIQLVQLQSQEIEALREEIGLLSRKGGHILPPSQAPMPPAPTAR